MQCRLSNRPFTKAAVVSFENKPFRWDHAALRHLHGHEAFGTTNFGQEVVRDRTASEFFRSNTL
jgi:hypothetical protein